MEEKEMRKVSFFLVILTCLFLCSCTKAKESSLDSSTKWDVVSFGSYKGQPIEWVVLDRTGDELTLLSLEAIDMLPYQNPICAITWERSTIRAYLNGSFMDEAFSSKEKAMILTVELENEGNEFYEIDGGADTSDCVFLLSKTEYETYFASDEYRWIFGRCEASSYAKDIGIHVDSEGFCSWWLRSPGNEDYSVAFVEEDGRIFNGGAEVDIDYYYGIRPVIVIRI